MASDTALSGNMETSEPFDLQAFTRAFVAQLVVEGRPSVRPREPAVREGFARVVQQLDKKIEELETKRADPKLLRQLIRIANQLRPSNNGAFEGFEAAFRSLQLTFTICPNPFYEEIAFSVPQPYAKATVEGLPGIKQSVVKEAVEAFIGEYHP